MRLTWPTRDDAPIDIPARSLLRRVSHGNGGVSGDPSDPVRVLAGDNLHVMRSMLAEGLEGRFALAYLDPPYMSGTDYALESGSTRTVAYDDRWQDQSAYLDHLWPRLRLVHRLLGDHGTIWVQVDHRAVPMVAPLLTELFGHDQIRNVVAWRRAPPLGRQAQGRQFPRNVDALFCYAKGRTPRWNPQRAKVPIERSAARFDESSKRHYTLAPRGDYTDESVARLEREGRIHRTPSGKVYVKYWLEEGDGGELTKPRAIDAMWDDVVATRHATKAERTGYPTQKPEALLARIIAATSDAGDWVLDPYAGSGTTALVATRLGRRCVTIDQSDVAHSTLRARLDRAGVPFTTEALASTNRRARASR